MSITLQQPPIVLNNVLSRVQFWNAGMNAYRAHIAYAVETGMSPEDTFQVARAQRPLLRLIGMEADAFRGRVDAGELKLNDEELYMLSLFRHDVVGKEVGTYHGWMDILSFDRRYLKSWWEGARFAYTRGGTVADLLRGVESAYLPLALRNGMTIECQFQTGVSVKSHRRKSLRPHTLMFAHRADYDLARTAVANLVENSIKYYCRRADDLGVISLGVDEYTLAVCDNGMGMEPQFAARLGCESRIREGRAADVTGSGIGWTSIGASINLLGWGFSIMTEPERGTSVMIEMSPASFLPAHAMRVREHAHTHEVVPAADIVAAAEVFRGALPFQGYRELSDGGIDFSKSPIFKAIENARMLMGQLEE